MDDFDIIRACVSGEKAGWDEFVRRHTNLIYDSVHRTFRHYGRVPQPEAVADLHQEIFLCFLSENGRILRQYEGRNGCSLAHYVRTVSVRKVIDHLRREQKTVSLDQVDPGAAPHSEDLIRALTGSTSAADRALEGDNRAITAKMLAHLKDDERALCTRVFLEQQEPAVIARDMGISVDYFYTRKKRLLEKLRAIALKHNLFTS